MTFISHLQNKNKTILYLIVFILFSLIIFAPSLLGDPFWDDWVFIFNSYTHKQFLGSPLNFFPGGSEPKAWPVFYTILWAMIKLFKANYFLYHLSNIITHAINGFLVWKIFERLRIRNAFLVALLFICHPLQLFTVSWIIQLKTIFSIFFLLVSIWFLIDFYKQDKIHYYFLALFFFVVSLLTKSTTVAFGAVIIFSYPIFKKKLSFKRFFVLFIMPFLILSIVSTVRTAWNYNVKDYLNRESFKSGEVAEINNSELIYSHNNLDNLIKPGEVPYYKTNFVEKSVLSFKNFFRYISFIVYPHNSESIFQVSTNTTYESTEFLLLLICLFGIYLLFKYLLENQLYFELLGVIFFIASLLPFSGLVYIPIFMLSNFVPYWLSIPFLGLLPIIGRFFSSQKILIAIVLVFAGITHWQAYEFINVQDIFLNSINRSPDRRVYQIALIEHYVFTGQCQKAKELYKDFKQTEFSSMFCLDIKTNTCKSKEE